ncbi:MAG TPA: VOC family protein [Dehalococcoidia bacterium]
MFKALDLDHLAVATRDLDAAINTYRENFGLEAERWGEVPALGIRNAVLPVGEAFIELITPLTGEGPVARFLEERGEGMYLISIAVDDLDAAMADLRERGVRVMGEPVPIEGGRMAFVHPSSTHGVLLQLVQRGPAAE